MIAFLLEKPKKKSKFETWRLFQPKQGQRESE